MFKIKKYSVIKSVSGLSILLFLFALTTTPSNALTIASDTFSDNNGIELHDHNNSWMQYAGFDSTQTVTIQNNTAVSNSDTLYTWHANGELTTQTVSFDLKVQLDQDRGYLIIYRNDVSNNTGFYGRGIDLIIHEDGSLNYHDELNTYSGSHPAGTVQNSSWYNFRVVVSGDIFTAYLNNILLLSGTINDPVTFATGNGGFELRQAGSIIDNFLVTDEADPPTETLNIPLLKQTSEPWQGLVYDSANLWSSASPSIKSWGCALTSAAMVLNYHGLFKLPSSAVITPGTLNSWLKNEKDGYVRNGLINWLAISRLSKKAKQSGYNENFHHDALEFNRLGSNSQNQLKSDLENGIPGILEEPGHFVVAKGKTDTTFLINDPFYNRLTLSDNYQNSYISLLRYVPSHTDLSYFMFIGDNNLSLKLLDQNNNETGETFSLLPIQNSLIPNQDSGPVAIEFLNKNPASGNYKLIINAPALSLYAVDLYLYDINGGPFLKTITGFINNGKSNTFLFSYDHDDSNNVTIKKVVTYSSFIDDINNAIALKQIDKKFGKGLILQVKLAEKLQPKRKSQSIIILKSIQQILNASNERLLKHDTLIILNEDVSQLISSL